MNQLEGKVALITGGNSGIGLATAKEFHAQGAKVAITGRDNKALERVRAELGERLLAIPQTLPGSVRLSMPSLLYRRPLASWMSFSRMQVSLGWSQSNRLRKSLLTLSWISI